MKVPDFYIGADPEIFLADAAGGLVSAIGVVGGTKQTPRRLAVLGNGYAVQEDNVAVEFNIPPCSSEEEFRGAIKKTMAYLLEEVKQQGYRFSMASAAEFPIEQLATAEAWEFGCEPDWNAWTRLKNEKPKAEVDELRSCGGHVHVGKKFNGVYERMNFVKYMDLFLGVGSVLMDDGELRKQLYGSAGACRLKPYGVEYRTLSNFWIFKEPLIDWVYRNTKKAIDAYDKDAIDINSWEGNIVKAINENNKETAMSLVDHFGLEVLDAGQLNVA